MKSVSQTRLVAVLLAVATVAACVLAGLNFANESGYDVPTDGSTWIESQSATQPGLEARQVPAGSPAARGGVRRGDLLIAVNDHPTPTVAALERLVFRSGVLSTATYTLLRPSAQGLRQLEIPIILEQQDRSINQGLRLIALVYLCIGIYVLFRRWTAPKSTHFYIFCLVSFVLYAFKYTGQLDTFDWVIYWGNVAASALQPALFLHFAVSFTGASREENVPPYRRRLALFTLYLPGLFLVGLRCASILLWQATEQLQHRLDQIDYGYLALYYVVAGVVFWRRYRRAEMPLQRQQLKWLTSGTILAVTPFTLFYVIPFLSGWPVFKVAALSLVFVPLTFSWAIVRYRLMDVDLIIKRGVAYTLATAALVGGYFSIVAITAGLVNTRLPNLRVWGLIAAVIVTGLVFDPLKRAIQTRVDRIFDPKRFDYRETLIDFGRSLNAQTDLRALVESIVERLPQTLLLTRVAVFLADDAEALGSYRLVASHGLPSLNSPATLDLGFLDFDGYDANAHLFLENPQHVIRLPEPQRRTAAMLDLNYYLPCRVARRQGGAANTIAVIGLGRTDNGDFLSSEDMELLESLAGYIGIAIQNAQLYTSLEQKISDFERLKEFNENIVESINIGVFAVDLEDRIESWNAQMEVMYATPRASVLRKPLADVFPADFLAEFHRVRNEHGTHTLYKFRLDVPGGSSGSEARTANIAIAPLLTRDFVTVGRIVLVDDITGRIHLESQLAQAEKLSSIGLLAAGVAHEVNTPLAVISSYTQMLTKQEHADVRLAPILEKITQQTFRASEIVNGLLNFSRTGGSEFSSLDLNAILHDTLILLEHPFKTARITVDTSYAGGLPLIYGNQGKLQQVLLNLFLNARDAMHDLDHRTISITTRSAQSGVIVEIADSGTGMESEVVQRIYDPFFTTKGTPKEGQHKGTGLGLAVTYGIMQEHAGKIHVESVVGRGTTFRLEFPAAGLRQPDPGRKNPVHA